MHFPDQGFTRVHARMSHYKTIRAYRAVANEARRVGGVASNSNNNNNNNEEVFSREDPQRRSVLVLPAPPDVLNRDYAQYVKTQMEKARKDWGERCAGTGRGYWI